MIAPFVNIEVTSDQCDAVIFHMCKESFPGCFSRKLLVSVFISPGYREIHVYSYAIFLLPKSGSSAKDIMKVYFCYHHTLL